MKNWMVFQYLRSSGLCDSVGGAVYFHVNLLPTFMFHALTVRSVWNSWPASKIPSYVSVFVTAN